MWGGYAAAVIVAGVAVVMLQKKGASNNQDFDRAEELLGKVTLLENELRETKDSLVAKDQELDTVKQSFNEKSSALENLENELREAKDSFVAKDQELEAAKQTLNEKSSALETLENDFESKMDDVVESSIQKIAHAEQAKEDAIDAAEANYEAAAEAHATIKEKESIIADLQKKLDD